MCTEHVCVNTCMSIFLDNVIGGVFTVCIYGIHSKLGDKLNGIQISMCCVHS